MYFIAIYSFFYTFITFVVLLHIYSSFCSHQIIFITYFFYHFFFLPLLYYEINCVFLFFY
ncbi:hypothetical protein C3L55_05365 [Veillonellaceae bacterium M1-70]|nr:hypothetical protein [Veillonellaceae bacterium M1-70]